MPVLVFVAHNLIELHTAQQATIVYCSAFALGGSIGLIVNVLDVFAKKKNLI